MWLLPSPARARRACPLPGQRLSIFSILAPERAKKLSIGVHGFAENRENRQPLSRESASGAAVAFFCNRRDARVRAASTQLSRSAPTKLCSRRLNLLPHFLIWGEDKGGGAGKTACPG